MKNYVPKKKNEELKCSNCTCLQRKHKLVYKKKRKNKTGQRKTKEPNCGCPCPFHYDYEIILLEEKNRLNQCQ